MLALHGLDRRRYFSSPKPERSCTPRCSAGDVKTIGAAKSCLERFQIVSRLFLFRHSPCYTIMVYRQEKTGSADTIKEGL